MHAQVQNIPRSTYYCSTARAQHDTKILKLQRAHALLIRYVDAHLDGFRRVFCVAKGSNVRIFFVLERMQTDEPTSA